MKVYEVHEHMWNRLRWCGEYVADSPEVAFSQASRELRNRDVANGYGDNVMHPLRVTYLREATPEDMGEGVSSGCFGGYL